MVSIVRAAMVVAMSISMILTVPQAAAAEAPPKGSLVIAGGAVRGDNTVIWQRVVQLAGDMDVDGAIRRQRVRHFADLRHAGGAQRMGRADF